MLKRLSILFLAITLLTGCGGRRQEKPGTEPESALSILQTVWNSFSDQEKFPVYGGDSENMTDGAPGDFSITDTDGLQYNLLVPATQLSSVEQAASMTHGMMVNNFTCGVFRLTEGKDAKLFADAMAEGIRNNQWLCGTPEQMLVATVGSRYVVMCFGLADVLSTFSGKLTTAYPGTQVLHNQAIA